MYKLQTALKGGILKIFIAIAVFFLQSNSIHANPFQFESASQGFSELESIFATAETPNPTTLIGWHSGRCFSNENADNQYGVLLIGLPKNDENGRVLLDKVFTMTNIGGRPEAFDQLSPHVSNMIEMSIDDSMVSQMKPAIILEGAIVGGLNASPGFLESQFAVKKIENTFIINGIQGEFEEWCYAFKKIK